ncbi:hypothetical protein PYW07_010414 [Mythimna separata]|uniref:Serpin domain-containing protein n=1 Tax=Mythimna separata TaxID=271217 RepID=A0AAD7YAB8_MYTSE|nr:hypothetical protein PYW07_010414 [Mythimna separata]
MKKLILVLLVACTIQISTQQNQQLSSRPCNINRDLSLEYGRATYQILVESFRSAAIRGNFHFVYAPNSIWIMVAAIAEGADFLTQQKLFKYLNLPYDPCIRQAYYQLAITRAFSSNDVYIDNLRLWLFDYGVTLSRSWYDVAVKNSLLEVSRAPIRSNPVAAANKIRRIMSSPLPRINLRGNSALLETLDYDGFWTTGFEDAVIKRAPFYNLKGKQIGAVDMMWMQRTIRMGYNEDLQVKILELPVGLNGRYRLLFGMAVGTANLDTIRTTVTGDIVTKCIESLRLSLVPIFLAIPLLEIENLNDMKAVMGDLGYNQLFTDPGVTRYISNPPALPSSYLQRTSIVFNTTGLKYTPSEPEPAEGAYTGLDPILGREYIADRPFVFSLYDAKTWACLWCAAYSKPTYT